MANEEIKENVPPEEYVDPDAARAEDEDEAEPAPAGPAPIIKKKKLDADHAGAHGGAWKIALANCWLGVPQRQRIFNMLTSRRRPEL